jgi:micrococcal nuclease
MRGMTHPVLGTARILVTVVVATAVGLVGVTLERETAAGRPSAPTVVRVVDGDTIVVRLGGGEETVRLVGIDTPETVDPRRPVGCFGTEASRRTKALLPVGTRLRLERDVEARDRYGRVLAYVYRADDHTFVNLALAEEGFAEPLTIPPNVTHASRFAAAAAAARAAGRGLWGACR